ncbi:MAG: tRNA glutamyl-Q(34) synthetase GluQRS [Pontixanthobacter sp.]
MIVTRFAPSPNGPLHLGHALSAIRAHDLAHGVGEEAGGDFLLRIEDIDGARSKPELARAFRSDLRWLGLGWREVPPQSERLASYREAAQRLRAMELLYPCTCSRAEVAAASHTIGLEGPIYPGTCRGKTGEPGAAAAWRLDVDKAAAMTGPLTWHDELGGAQTATPERLGDQVLVRRDNPASYHLAATLDDAADGVTLVTRGRDLFNATHIHRLLQALLGLAVPRWHHHALVLDGDGRKLAKRRGSRSLDDWRADGADGTRLAAQLRAGHLPYGYSLSRT